MFYQTQEPFGSGLVHQKLEKKRRVGTRLPHGTSPRIDVDVLGK